MASDLAMDIDPNRNRHCASSWAVSDLAAVLTSYLQELVALFLGYSLHCWIGLRPSR